jgi:hypothetical protein
MILYQTCLDEIRTALSADGLTNLYNDAMVRRFILKHSNVSNTYYFSNHGNGNFVYHGTNTYDYFYDISFTEISNNIYQCNCNGTIHPAVSYDIAISSIEPSPTFAFNIVGDFTQHFITDSVFSVIGPASTESGIVLDSVTTIANSQDYTCLGSTYNAGYTTVLVDDIPSASVEDGLIRFTPINTDTRSQLPVTAMLVDFAEVMHDVLLYLATATSRKELQSLVGSTMGSYIDPYEMLMKQARRWRGLWSIK